MTDLPSAEYKVDFTGGAVSAIFVHSDESLEGALGEMLAAAGLSQDEVVAVSFLRTFGLDEEVQELV